MKLYLAPGACSLSPHITLREAGATFEIERVDLSAKRTASGGDFHAINPKGYVPALELETGEVLTEGSAIIQFIADNAPAAALAPQNGTIQRARMQEHLNYIASELHKAFSPLFNASASKEARDAAPAHVASKLGHFERILSDGRSFLLGERFSVADGYLFAVARWTGPTGIGLDRWPHLAAYMDRVEGRPAVQAALAAEAA